MKDNSLSTAAPLITDQTAIANEYTTMRTTTTNTASALKNQCLCEIFIVLIAFYLA